VTEEDLNEAITTLVNGYSQCELTKVWGLGKSASGDGTKWDLSLQNLMSEYHIRYRPPMGTSTGQRSCQTGRSSKAVLLRRS